LRARRVSAISCVPLEGLDRPGRPLLCFADLPRGLDDALRRDLGLTAADPAGMGVLERLRADGGLALHRGPRHWRIRPLVASQMTYPIRLRLIRMMKTARAT